MTTRYVVLCRHGPHRNGTLRTVTSGGQDAYPTDAIGQRLKEQLDAIAPDGAGMPFEPIWCADTGEARATLYHLLKALGRMSEGTAGSPAAVPIILRAELTPPKASQPGADDTLIKELRAGSPAVPALAQPAIAQPGTVKLIVGHQPQLSWIADGLLRTGRNRLRRPPPVPIDRAGLVCILLDGDHPRRDKLAWTISFDDTKVAEQVREKIRLKMDTARLLASALTLGLTVILGVLFDKGRFDALGDRRWAAQAAAGLLLLAAVLYFATMYAYDRLLMPDRFWGERRPPGRESRRSRGWLVERPPSSAAWVLYQNMMRVWRNLFTLASLLAGIAIALLSYAALRLRPWQLLAVGVPAVIVAGLWVWWSRPVLGSED